MANKLTNKKAVEIAIQVLQKTTFECEDFSTTEVIDKLKTIASSFDKKISKPTATQIENVQLSADILAFLEKNPNLIVSCTDLIKKIPSLAGLTTQRVSPMMKKMEKAGKVIQLEDKGKHYYQLVKGAK